MGTTLHTLPPKAKDTGKALSEFCTDHGIFHQFLGIAPSGHCVFQVNVKGLVKTMRFSASPSDPNAHKAALRQLKHLLREMGWEPKKREPAGLKTKAAADIFKNQRVSVGPASEGKVIKMTDQNPIPKPFENYDPSRGAKSYTEAERAALNARNDAMLKMHERGANEEQVHAAALEAGWNIKLKSISPMIVKAKKARLGLSPTDRLTDRGLKKKANGNGAVHFKTVTRTEPAIPPQVGSADDIAIEIAQAIAPIIRKHILHDAGEMAELRAKAEKFDTFKKLMG